MTRKRSNKRKGQSRSSRSSASGSQNRGASVPFRQVVFLDSLLSSGYAIGQTDCVVANLGPRAAAIARQYEYWRFNSLRVRGVLDCAAVSTEISGATPTQPGVAFGIGWGPYPAGDISSQPASFTDLSQMNCYQMESSSREISIVMGKKLLRANPVKWFRANPTGSTFDDNSAGVFQYLINTRSSLGNTYRMWVTIEGEIQFEGQLSSDNTFEHQLDASASALEEQKNDEPETPFSAFSGLSVQTLTKDARRMVPSEVVTLQKTLQRRPA